MGNVVGVIVGEMVGAPLGIVGTWDGEALGNLPFVFCFVLFCFVLFCFVGLAFFGVQITNPRTQKQKENTQKIKDGCICYLDCLMVVL